MTTPTLTLQAPAKTNLSLRVLRKREDGFHEIDSTMVKLPELHDTLEFAEAETISFSCTDPTVPADDSNLVVKAAKAFEAASGRQLKHAITLHKRIPHGAGLGGGSSDAAATLLGLNQLHGQPLNDAQVHEIAAAIGSDIPFFLTAGAARVTGRGELIEPIESPPSLRLLMLKPSFSVATPDAYRRWMNSQAIAGIDYAAQQHEGVKLINDLERPVFEKHRFLAELKQWLLEREETTAALLSGSGSTVFAVLREQADGENLAQEAKAALDSTLWHWCGNTAS